MHELDRSDIEAARRLGRDEQTQVTAQLAGEHDLLLVTTREPADLGGDALGAHVELADLLGREGRQGVELQRSGLDEGLARVPVEHEVLGDRELTDETVFLAVFGHETHARVENTARRLADQLGAVEGDRAENARLQAHDRLGELGLAVALNAGDAEDLAALHRERHVVDEDLPHVVGHGELGDHEGVIARRRGSLVDRQRDGAPHHERCELGVGRRGLGLADHLPEADHGDAVGDLAHLTKLVGDEDDGRALVLELTHDVHQLVGLLGREHRGRLVEDEHLRVTRERLDDLDALLHTDREVFDLGVGIDVETEAGADLAHLGARGLEVEHAASLGVLVAEHDVLSDGEDGDQHEVLVHHADAGVHGVAGTLELLHFVVQEDLALVGSVEAVEHVHQGRLAGAVLTQETVNLTGLDDEVDVVIRRKRSKALRNATKLELHVRPSCAAGVAALLPRITVVRGRSQNLSTKALM